MRWASAAGNAKLLMSQAAAAHPQNAIIMEPVMNVRSTTVEERVGDLAGRAREGGFHMYIGSTTSPQWRWEGGEYYPSEEYYDLPGKYKAYMPGHSRIWERMHVLGSWPDSETAAMEEVAIKIGKGSGALVDNIADDSRGLPRRGPYNYAFVYVVSASRERLRADRTGYFETSPLGLPRLTPRPWRRLRADRTGSFE